MNRDALFPDNDVPWEIEAESISTREGVHAAEGDAVLTVGPLTLSSDKAVFDSNDYTAEIPGWFRLEWDEDILSGESGTFNLRAQTGTIRGGELFIRDGNYHIKGNPLEKTGDDTYRVENFSFTTCDGDCPVWRITGREVHIPMEGYATAKGAAFRIRDVPVLYIPYIIFPARTKRQTGLLLPSIGYSGLNGIELEIPFFWAVSDSTDATLYERYMSERGLMHGLEFRYAAPMDSKGTYNFDILRDRIREKDINDPDQAQLSLHSRTNRTRYWLRGRTDQQLFMGVKARADFDIVSDQDYLREFEGGLAGFEARPDLVEDYGRPMEEMSSPTRRSAIRLSSEKQDYSLQALASWYQRPEGFSNDTTPQPVIGLSFSSLPTDMTGFNFPLFFAINSSYDYIWRDFGQKGHNLNISPSLTVPARIGSYLEFETSLGYTKAMQWLGSDNPDISYQSRDAMDFSAGFSTALERIFETDWKGTDRVRHKMAPFLTYEYRTHKDEEKYQPWFDSVDAEGDVSRLAFSLDNFIDARMVDDEGNVSYSRWVTFRAIQGYDMHEARKEISPGEKKAPFEPLKAILTLSPFDQLYFDAEARWDHYRKDFAYADLSVRFNINRSNDRRDEFRVDYVYNDTGSKGLSYYVDINLAKGFSIGSSVNKDIEEGYNIEKSYWLKYRSQCWGIRLGVDKRDSRSRIMLSFQMLGFGS